MTEQPTRALQVSSIIDNRGENTLLAALQRIGEQGRDIRVAAAFFSLDALLLLADQLEEYGHIRILFGDDASPRQRRALLEMLRTASDRDLLVQRERGAPLLSALQKVQALFAAGRVEARCYTREKFHAKAYLVQREFFPNQLGVLGSGNFTRPGLVQNVELNVLLTPEQTAQLDAWYEERWAEAAEDVVTEDLLAEIRRQIDLYEPHILYLKALYLWGQDRQGRPEKPSRLLDMLDMHQEDGYFQALRVLERDNGVMVCDGVGLGKSFIALAIMDHFCREGKNVLLIAPKNILTNSWDGYLRNYLQRYRSPFGNIHEMAMTELGFEPATPAPGESEDGEGDSQSAAARLLSPAVADRLEELQRLAERADVVVIDESHNFRTRSANRYVNLFKMLEPVRGRKKVVLLTATPINTCYTDLSSQLALITHEGGSISGIGVEQIRSAARVLDQNRPSLDESGQLAVAPGVPAGDILRNVLERVAIQRSRTTCRELSRAAGRELRFPERQGPECVEYSIGRKSEAYAELVDLADRRFRPGVRYLQEVQQFLQQQGEAAIQRMPAHLRHGPPDGIKLAAFIPEQYRWQPGQGGKQYTDEIHLARLVFANALKQLESSPPAFQGILQSLGTGLLARLSHVLGEEHRAEWDKHLGWVQTSLFDSAQDTEGADGEADLVDEGETLDASGGEGDDWIKKAIRLRSLDKKLADLRANQAEYDLDRWRTDILGDLTFLREIHDAVLAARTQPDPKLERVLPVVTDELEKGRRVLVFTQSIRTAEYLERELKSRLSDCGVARIDSRVEDTRQAIVHAFCPGYNAAPSRPSPSVPARVDVLISTDVLSEGVNLQEAGAILNYDIHWNPVRLIQRIGRVDRRLDPVITPEPHSFVIYNVLPATAIEKIIGLVAMVENRTLKISRAVGIDQKFFSSDDPADSLKEFNRLYEGEMTGVDKAAAEYARHFSNMPRELQQLLDALPPGAFGVWNGAPHDGLFALYTMERTEDAKSRERATLPGDTRDDAAREAKLEEKKFLGIIGRPVMALERPGKPLLLDTGEILDILAGTQNGDPSGAPSDEAALAGRLRALRDAVRSQFRDANLPQTIRPKLVCWMELRQAGRAGE